jgi:hypothetical protein
MIKSHLKKTFVFVFDAMRTKISLNLRQDTQYLADLGFFLNLRHLFIFYFHVFNDDVSIYLLKYVVSSLNCVVLNDRMID